VNTLIVVLNVRKSLKSMDTERNRKQSLNHLNHNQKKRRDGRLAMSEKGKGKTFTTGRPSRKEELMKVVQEAQAPFIKALNNISEVVKHQQERVKVLEDNQAQFVKVLESLKSLGANSNPGKPGEPGQGGGLNLGQVISAIIMRGIMGEGQNPTKMALDIAKEFNRTYMTGQRNMLRMLSLISKKKSFDALFSEEED